MACSRRIYRGLRRLKDRYLWKLDMIPIVRALGRQVRRMESKLPETIRYPLIELRQRIAVGASHLVRDRIAELPRAWYSVPDHETFFGYYDRTPESHDGTAVLAHAVQANDPSQKAKICLFEDGDHRVIGSTDLWSWQLGARLGWLPTASAEDPNPRQEVILFNTRHEGGPGTVLVDRQGHELSRFAGCVYDHAPDGSFGLGLDMARLGWTRPGYGYPTLVDAAQHMRVPDKGVSRIDFASGAQSELVSMNEIVQIRPQANFAEAFHYLNHISISPDGAKFIVYHFWLMDPKTTDDFEARVLVGDCAGGGLQVLEDVGRPSHYTWRNADELIVFRIEADTSGYQRYQLNEDSNKPFWDFVLNHDGHQSFNPVDPSLFLMDTYPDWLRGEQQVHLYREDVGGGAIMRLRADPRSNGAARCDLHPRWSRDGSAIYMDTTDGNMRRLLRVVSPTPLR